MKTSAAASSPLTSQGLVSLFVCLFLLEIGTLFISENVLSFTRRVVSYFVLPLVPNTLPLVGSAEHHSLKNLSVTNPEGVNPVKCFGTGGPEFGPADKFR